MAQPDINMIAEASAPKPATKEIDVFYTSLPDRNSEEIAMLSVDDRDDDWSIGQINKSARKVGADGAIITCRVVSYGYYAKNIGMGAGEGYGLSALAIRYEYTALHQA